MVGLTSLSMVYFTESEIIETGWVYSMVMTPGRRFPFVERVVPLILTSLRSPTVDVLEVIE